MITFKQFLKQKKLYNLDTETEFNDMVNSDLDVIDPDLDVASKDVETPIVEPDVETPIVEPVEVQSEVISEDGECASADSSGGTTFADIASVPYGLGQKPSEDELLIKRMDAFL